MLPDRRNRVDSPDSSLAVDMPVDTDNRVDSQGTQPDIRGDRHMDNPVAEAEAEEEVVVAQAVAQPAEDFSILQALSREREERLCRAEADR